MTVGDLLKEHFVQRNMLICGCDGETYSNVCYARVNGVNSFTSGEYKINIIMLRRFMICLPVKIPEELCIIDDSLRQFIIQRIQSVYGF